jgi:hypothetical protein
MTRKVFYSFHYDPDHWRASQVRNMGLVEGNQPASDNDWEEIKKGGGDTIQEWIDSQMKGRSCAVVLIGTNTASRKWVKYEIKSAWNSGKGLVGIYIHNLKNSNGEQATKGVNPFSSFTMKKDDSKLSDHVKAHDPPFTTSKYVYEHISDNLEDWIEEAIDIRDNY